MRILVISPEQLPVPPIKGGSVETCMYNIFKRMARKDHVTIISRAHPRLTSYSKEVGGKLRMIRIGSSSRSRYIRIAMKKVRRSRFDLIQIENRPTFVPYVRKCFPRTPIMLSLHSLTFMSQLSAKRADAILRKVNGVTSVVSFVTKTMRRKYPRHARKFKTAILGCDTRQFRPRSSVYKRAMRKKWHVSGTYNLLFAGRTVPKKGLHTLVRAAAILKRHHRRLRIVVVGASWPGARRRTPYMNYVNRLAKRLGVRIRFTGYVPPSVMPQMYHLGDVFVCPTQYREGFATVNSEAMASQIPVVASHRGGILEVVRHGSSGVLVKAYRSPHAFAKAILWIMRSQGLRKRITSGGRQRIVRHFSWFNTVHSLRNHYKILVRS